MAENFLTVLSTLYASSCFLNNTSSFPNDYSKNINNNDVFDVIIIGGGAAGCVLTNRLSQKEHLRVLLVEAGSYPPGGTEVPGLFFTSIKSNIDWSYENERSSNFCQGYEKETCTTVSGKVLGGSTTINGMIYMRALPDIYDSWAEMGNVGWDYENIRKYYQQFEGSIVKTDDYEKEGELTLSNTSTKYDQIRQLLFNSSKELGLSFRSGNEKFGVIECYSTIRNNRRCSAAKAFLTPIRLRRNLFMMLNTLATKILFDGKKAIGVQVKFKNKLINITATREVIVTAGSIESPKLLMLSGIGPRAHLESLGISVLADLPVGKNFHDHFIVPGLIATIPNSKQNVSYLKAVLDYCGNREGILAVTNTYNIQWFLNTKNFTKQSDATIQFFYMHKDATGLMASVFKNIMNFKNPTINSLRKATSHADALQFGCIISEPLSRGEILLRSTNPEDKPRIYGNYLSDKRDVAVFVETMNRVNNLLNTPTMRKYNVNLYQLDVPNCNTFIFGTSSYWECILRNIGSPCYHPVGSCKMAPTGDPTGVVTPELKVHGFENIRVVGASIMPKITDRNLMSPVYVIAHKAADLILNDKNIVF